MDSWLIILLLFLPLMGGMVGYVVPQRSAMASSTGTLLSFIISVACLIRIQSTLSFKWEWLPDFELTILVDSTSLLLISLVTFISFLVQVFSSEYMREDAGINRYYAKLGLFVFSMIGLLMAENLLLLFVFWELVGLASYLLIGFWFTKEGIPGSARMAFMVNRVADAALLAGIILLYARQGSFSITSIGSLSFLTSLLIAIGAFGKSAQFPFSGWLIKAMVGPTPVSALIHAATMVAAGVYLLYRVAPFLHGAVLLVIVAIGTLTAFYAAICAIIQFDIKKVLAYSTISQLGYMIMGIGVGAREASLFHLFTHAFFKAGLFLGAASVIHYLHKAAKVDAQDMRVMGGLKNYLPWTYRSFLVCGLALAGLPMFSGFMSKDGILIGAWSFAASHGTWAYVIPDLALITALITAFYVGRMILLVFWGEVRVTISKTFSEVKTIAMPLVLLAILSVWVFHHWNPLAHTSTVFSLLSISTFRTNGGELVPFLSILLSISGLLLAYSFFKRGTNYHMRFSSLKEPSSLTGSLVFNGLMLTRLYERVGVLFYAVSQVFNTIDKKIIDTSIHFVAVSSVILSKVTALADRFAIDGPVNWTAELSAYLGKRLAGLSSRDGQTQLAWLLVVVILILYLIIVF